MGDKMTYANIKLGMHDVHDENGAVTGKQQSVVHETLAPLMDALALKYPHWEFVESDTRIQWNSSGGRMRAADGFKVYEKREELGSIRVDHWCRTGKRFWIDNFRIDQQKTRGSGFKTKHVDKALKHIAKYFGVKDHTEMMEEAQKEADYAKNNMIHSLSNEMRVHWRKLDDCAAEFLLTQWGAFAEWMKEKSAAFPHVAVAVEKYPEACANYDEGSYVTKMIEDGRAWLVKISNSDYIVKQGGNVAVWSSESLPAKVRRNLGMLKLVQDGQMISNVGIRVSESTYYVLGETA
jgi:hypothetical protein